MYVSSSSSSSSFYFGCDFQAGEALGAIGSPEVLDVLREYAKDPQIEVLILKLYDCTTVDTHCI